MATPLATVADALIEFILSLLRDPAAVAEFKADPQKVLDSRGLGDIGADDVRAVAPVVVDHPSVSLRPQGPSHPGPGPGPTHPVYPPSPHPEPPVIREISTIANKFHIDNRTTIVDQSVNQNIWAKGDVTQYFDQKAVLAVGDEAFRDKCLTRIERLSDEGRTLVVVSHDLPLVERLCRRGVVLDSGRLVHDGPVREAVEHLRAVL